MGVWGGRFGVIFDLKCWKMFQMLNAAGIFSKSGIYDAFFYKMGTLLFPSLFFKSAKTVIFDVFNTFSLFFHQKWPFLTLFEPSKMDENPFGTYFAKNDKKRHFCKNSFFENVFHKIDSLNFRVAKKC